MHRAYPYLIKIVTNLEADASDSTKKATRYQALNDSIVQHFQQSTQTLLAPKQTIQITKIHHYKNAQLKFRSFVHFMQPSLHVSE